MSDPSIPIKRYFPTQALAQAWCDAIHTWIYNNNPDYKISVDTGQTLRWCFPQQDMTPIMNIGDISVPLGDMWYVTIKDRCIGGCTDDIESSVPWTTTDAILQEDGKTMTFSDNSFLAKG